MKNIEEFNSNFTTTSWENLDFSDYLKVNALSNSGIENFRKSAAHFKWYEAHPKPATESMLFGSLVHCAILEPDEVFKRYAPKPEGYDGRKKEWKEFKEKIELTGIKLVDSLDYVAAIRIAKEVSEIEEDGLSTAIKIGKKEFSVFWEKDGIKRKARPDIYIPEIAMAIDIKTTRSPDEEGFEKVGWFGGYHRKAAWYKEGLEANGLACRHFLFIAIENDDYSDFKVYRMLDECLTVGQMQNDESLADYQNCLRTKCWPGYSKKILPLSFPSWVIAKLGDKYL